MRRAWIVGAGYVGGRVAAALAARGWAVSAVRRSSGAAPPGVTAVAADARDAGTYAAMGGAPEVAVFSVPSGGSAVGDAATDARAALTGLLETIGGGETRLLFLSSTGVYAERAGGWVDEDTTAFADGPRAARLLDLERLARSHGRTGVLRLGGIYGPGRASLVDRLRRGDARLPREVRWTNRIHGDDAARAIVHLAEAGTVPPTLLVTDSRPADFGEVLTWLAAELGVPAPPPEDDAHPAATGYRAEGNKRCSNARLLAAGVPLAYQSFREGYRALLAAERNP